MKAGNFLNEFANLVTFSRQSPFGKVKNWQRGKRSKGPWQNQKSRMFVSNKNHRQNRKRKLNSYQKLICPPTGKFYNTSSSPPNEVDNPTVSLHFTHSNIFELGETHWNTFKYTFKLSETNSNTFKLCETHSNTFKLGETHWNTSKYIQTHSNSVKQIQIHSNSMKHIEIHSNSMKHI